jgi:hypothetical protein
LDHLYPEKYSLQIDSDRADQFSVRLVLNSWYEMAVNCSTPNGMLISAFSRKAGQAMRPLKSNC